MRALQLTDYWQLDVVELPDPEPGPGDVAIDVIATGICGSDLHGFTGENGRRHPGQVMGHETVGTVRTVGAYVTDLSVGDLVTVNPVLWCGECRQCQRGREQACPHKSVIGVTADIRSAFAEQLIVRAENVVTLPPGTRPELGALVEPLAVGYHALLQGGCVEGDLVLVIGGGPIGQACVLAAQRLGAAAVVVSEPSAARRALCSDLGAATVDPGADDLAGAVSAALGGDPDVVVDAVGVGPTLATAFACSPLGGRIVLVGMGAPRVDLDAFAVSTAERTLVGSFCYSAQDFRDTAAWVGEEGDRLLRLVEGSADLDEAPAAFAGLARGEDASSKILVHPQGRR